MTFAAVCSAGDASESDDVTAGGLAEDGARRPAARRRANHDRARAETAATGHHQVSVATIKSV